MSLIKVKYKGKWMEPEDVAALREAQKKPVELPDVDVTSLPDRKELDPDVPLDQLCFEHPEVRSYITSKGKIRSGLKPQQREIALGILSRYGIGEKEASETGPTATPRALALPGVEAESEGTDRATNISGSPEDDLDFHNDERYGDKT